MVLSIGTIIEQLFKWPALYSLTAGVVLVADGKCTERSEMPVILHSFAYRQRAQKRCDFAVFHQGVHIKKLIPILRRWQSRKLRHLDPKIIGIILK